VRAFVCVPAYGSVICHACAVYPPAAFVLGCLDGNGRTLKREDQIFTKDELKLMVHAGPVKTSQLKKV
jgi:hypothetical protein